MGARGVNSVVVRAVTLLVSTQRAGSRATIVILAWNAWEHTRPCLDSLWPTLGPGDQVVVVDNGSTDATGEGLAGYPWVDVVRNEENQGFARGCNQGAAVARGDVVVFLNNDTIVHQGWLDELLAPFSDPEVGAVGPRSNSVSGHQLVEGVPYGDGDVAAIGEFAEGWRRAHAGRTSACARLVGFCLAVRADTFAAVEGFDEEYLIGGFEDDDLCMKLRTAGLRLVVAHGSFVHHAAHATFDANGVDWLDQQRENQRRFSEKWGTARVPSLCLISVCLIVKDEELMLASCLESVADLADEIVVYDTGSTDRTMEIARAAGATVIEGYWDESFGRARNAALAQAHGEWVLSLDADETLLADPASLRSLLADRRSDVEAYLVAIENLHGAGNARSVHTAIRLFRRTSCTWRHRLHEQVVAADDPGRRLRIGYLSGARIIHRGYAAEVFETRHKAARNLAIAEAALDDDELSRPYALMNYGRALESAGRSIDAIATLREAAASAEDPITQRLAVKNLIYILGRLGRFDESLAQVDELRRISVNQIAADIAEGRMRIAMGEAEAGLSLLARVPARGRDDDGMEYATHMLAAMQGEALATLGRFGAAADVVLSAVRSDGVLEADLGELASWLERAGRSPAEIGEALHADDLMPVLGRVLRQSPAVADSVLDGIWERFPDRLEPLAAAGRLAPRLPVARALVWSSRLRRRGLAGACPLVAMANDGTLDPRVRILAGAAAFGTFGERAVVNAVHDARRLLGPVALEESTAEIARIAPGLLEAGHLDMVPMAPAGSAQAATIVAGMPQRGRAAQLMAPLRVVAPAPRRGGINIVGPFEATSAEGAVARTLATELHSHGIAVSTTSYHADGRPGPVEWAHRDQGNHPFDTTLMVLGCDDLANYVIDHGAAPFEGRYMIGVWLWDLERPSEVMRTAARMVHEVWVPSRLAADAVARSTDHRVLRMTLPVRVKASATAATSDAPFTFVARVDYETGCARQNPGGVVEAFCAAFDPGAGPRLVIETAHAARYPAEHAGLIDAVAGRPDIAVHDRAGRAEAALEGRSAQNSCVVSLHRSEGTGLVLAQAMVMGIPTIVTAHSFGAEVQDQRDSLLIPFSHTPIPGNEYRCEPGGSWAEPDLDAAAKAMRLVFAQPTIAAARARRAQQRARRQFSPSRAVRAMHGRVAAVDRLRHQEQIPARGRPGQRLATAG
jgi:GT2 family glycosyltransferase/glycosyltransferase involved in cell wall biosynthesis